MSDSEIGLAVAGLGAVIGGFFVLFGWWLFNDRQLQSYGAAS